MFRALHRHGAPILAAGLTVPVFALSNNALSEQRVYVSGEALGRGVRLEYWKAKHENVVVLDLESELIQLGMTRIRDRSNGGAQFVHDATAVIRSTLDLALTELPNDEDAVVTTPNAHKVQGVVFEDDVKVCGIVLSKKREIFDSLLKVMEHSLPFESPLGSILIEETPKGDSRVVKATLPDGLEGHDVMLLVPDLNAIEKVNKTIHLLRQQGIEEEKITVVTLITCPEAADKFCQTFPSARLVTSSFDATRDTNGSIVPGFGDFEDRYLGIAGAIVDEEDEGQDNEKEETEKPNLQQKLTSWWGFGSGK